jgi:hypothetical protein
MNKLKEIQYYNNKFPGKLNDNLLFYFSFDTGNSIITPITGKTGVNENFLFSGEILPNIGDFWQNSGRGYINNNYINIKNTNNLINFQDFSFICVYENIGKTGATLLSTVSQSPIEYFDGFGVPYNSVVNMGFEFGLTANNKLFFEFYDFDGPQVFVSSFDLADKSSVFLNVANNAVFLGYYNFLENTIIANNFNFNSQSIFNPTGGLFIGKNPLSLNLYNYNKQFEGYIEQLLFSSPSIYQYEIENINKSFISNYIPATEFYNETLLTGVTGVTTGEFGEEILLTGFLYGITGYTTGIIGIDTGVVTGVEYIETGTYEDEFGNIEIGYEEVVLLGDVPITGFIPLSGILSLVESGTINENVNLETNRFQEFGKNSINLLSNLNSEDLIDIQIITGIYNQDFIKNFTSSYNNVSKNYVFQTLKSVSDNINYLLFANGLLTTSGSGINVGNVYSSNILISGGDYIPTKKGEFLFSNFDGSHNIYGDLLSGNIFIENNFSKNNSGILNTPNINNYQIFLNGQKLTSGVHYFNNDFEQLFEIFGEDISGKLILISNNFNQNITGFDNFYNLNNFYTNYSQIYKNGIRQTLNFDYIENGKFTLNNGRIILDIKNNLIYNNDSLFN